MNVLRNLILEIDGKINKPAICRLTTSLETIEEFHNDLIAQKLPEEMNFTWLAEYPKIELVSNKGNLFKIIPSDDTLNENGAFYSIQPFN